MSSVVAVATGVIGTLILLARAVESCVLVIERFPETVPCEDGANVVVMVALCRAANVSGSGGLLTLNPPSDVTTWVSVMALLLEFVRVRLRLLLEPTATFPKVRVPGVAPSFPETEKHPLKANAANNIEAKCAKISRTTGVFRTRRGLELAYPTTSTV
jgi:hypothetical protein